MADAQINALRSQGEADLDVYRFESSCTPRRMYLRSSQVSGGQTVPYRTSQSTTAKSPLYSTPPYFPVNPSQITTVQHGVPNRRSKPP